MKLKKHIIRFSEYMVSGGAQFWTGYGAYALFDKTFGWNFWIAKSTSYFIGATANYALERSWVFKRKRTKKQNEETAVKFYSLMLTNFVIDFGIVAGLRELGVTPYIGQFISAGFFTAWNYALFNLWVFNKKKQVPNRSK